MEIRLKETKKVSKINKKAFEEFQEKEKQKNILLHKVVLVFFILVDILLFIFLIIYKQQIYGEKKERIKMYSQLSQVKSKNRKLSSEIEKMQIGLRANIDINKRGITFIFKDRSEFDFIFDKIGFQKNKVEICFQGAFYQDDPTNFLKYCKGEHLLFLIEHKNHMRFGAYISKGPVNDTDGDYVVENDDKAFIYNLNNKKVYYQKSSPAYTIFKDGFFAIGDNDILIKDHFYEGKNSFCNFPKSYGDIDTPFCEITDGQKELEITELEVYIIS